MFASRRMRPRRRCAPAARPPAALGAGAPRQAPLQCAGWQGRQPALQRALAQRFRVSPGAVTQASLTGGSAAGNGRAEHPSGGGQVDLDRRVAAGIEDHAGLRARGEGKARSQRADLSKLSPAAAKDRRLAGDRATAKARRTTAPQPNPPHLDGSDRACTSSGGSGGGHGSKSVVGECARPPTHVICSQLWQSIAAARALRGQRRHVGAPGAPAGPPGIRRARACWCSGRCL